MARRKFYHAPKLETTLSSSTMTKLLEMRKHLPLNYKKQAHKFPTVLVEGVHEQQSCEE